MEKNRYSIRIYNKVTSEYTKDDNFIFSGMIFRYRVINSSRFGISIYREYGKGE
jgi:hypothetical protein